MNTVPAQRRQYVRYVGAEATKTEKQDSGNSVKILQSRSERSMSSADFYNAFADSYKAYSEPRMSYLSSVDKLVCETAGKRKHYLDVGTGDGRRAICIAKKVEAEEIVLLDNSERMLANVPENRNIRKELASITDYRNAKKFDLITCLWNVFGHIEGNEYRKKALLNIYELLNADGLVAIDLNNRYNLSHYGVRAFLKNIWSDLMRDRKRGIFPLKIGDCLSEVYIHNPFEIVKAAAKCGLKLRKKYYVHYGNGSIVKTFLSGQILYFFEKA
jgi:SAM-dependent methyltransferase